MYNKNTEKTRDTFNCKHNVMTKYEKEIFDELVDISEWMRGAAGEDSIPVKKSLREEILSYGGASDVYDVFAVLHMKNGDEIKLRNNALDSFSTLTYKGCKFDFHEEDDEGTIIEICYYDCRQRYHQTKVPLNSICWIDSWSEDIDWDEFRKEVSSGRRKEEEAKYAEYVEMVNINGKLRCF